MDKNRNVLDNERKRMGLFGKSLSDSFSSDKFTAKPKKVFGKASPSYFSRLVSKLPDVKFHNVLVAALLIIAVSNIADSFFGRNNVNTVVETKEERAVNVKLKEIAGSFGVVGKVAGGSVIVYKHNYGEDISDVFTNMSHQKYQRAAIFRLADKYYELYYKPVKENTTHSPIIFSLPSEKYMSSPLSGFLMSIGLKKSPAGNLFVEENVVLVLGKNGSKDKFLELLSLLGYKKDAYKTTIDGENIYVFSPKE